MPVVFISYSHDSEDHRDRVLGLAERLRVDGFDTRLDRYVAGSPAEGWQRWMLNQIDAADFVLVVCSETYYRRFRGHEVPGKGKGVDFEGSLITSEIYEARSRSLKFVPVFFSADAEKSIPEPLRSGTHYLLDSEARYEELKAFLAGNAGVEPAPIGKLVVPPRMKASPLTFGAAPGTAPQRVATSRLPRTTGELFGREKELARLEAAWQDRDVHLTSIVAWGGVGKTSLVSRWVADLARRNFDGADYFDWSFYSQGTRDQSTASADAFVDAALRFFGDVAIADSAIGAWEKGARLAELVGKRRTLLVLDGLEPLQHPPGPLAGELKDPAIRALLRGLAAKNAGLCVITTREQVAELAHYRGGVAQEWILDRLSVPAGVELLRTLGVQGNNAELSATVEEVDGHALTLNLLGRFLRDAHDGDVRQRALVRLSEADRELRGGHAFNVMAAYEGWFAAEGEQGQRQLAVLRLLGLFDRPASAECLAALRKEPVIEGLTEPLLGIGEAAWKLTLNRLTEVGLIESNGGAVDAHPLIREYFARRLQAGLALPSGATTGNNAAWREAHGRLFDFLKDTTEYRPATLAGLQPLYQAVYHGCQAGRQQEACDEVYDARISREAEAYVVRKLGAFGADLRGIACFFEKPWSRVSPSLAEAAQAWLLSQAAFSLRALGRLREAVEPMRAGLDAAVRLEIWSEAARRASNLSELELTLGEVAAAVADAEQAVLFADRSDDAALRMDFCTTLADARHQAGEEGAALELFREAEHLQAKMQPQYPLLYSLQGYQYCDLLLAPAERAAASGRDTRADDGECDEVERRATQTLEWVKGRLSRLDDALDHLSLGRARLYRALLEGRDARSLAPAQDEIEKAVAGLLDAGDIEFVARGLLTRAWLRYAKGDEIGAREELDEAAEIAERGSMRLLLADVALYRARFFGDRAALAEARRLVEECGYGRRRAEVAELEERFRNAQGSPRTSPTPTGSRKGRLPQPLPGGFPGGDRGREFRHNPRARLDAEKESLVLSANSEQLPPPKSDADFESLCLDLFRAVWGDPGAQKNGRSGQPQAGVDVFGKYQGRQVGVQCKQTEQRRLPASMLVEEVGKARGSATKPGFTPALSAFVLATTAPRDAELQKKARELSTDDFEVSVWSWDDIVEELFHRRTLLRDIFPIYWPTIARLGPSVEEVLDLLLKRLETLNTKPVAQPRGAPAPATAPQPTRPSAALEVWQKKLDYLLGQEPITVDPDAKFRLAALIEEARQKIREHRGSA